LRNKSGSSRREIKKSIRRSWQPFIRCYRDNFGDKRLFHRFTRTLKGLLVAQTPKVQLMAAALPQSGVKFSSVAKGIYRFLQNCHYDWQVLLVPLYRKAKSLFSQEEKVLGIVDLSSVEKPYARNMEALCRVRKSDGSGTTNGYMTVSVLLNWAGKTGLGYFKLFSHQCELMSQNSEIDLAMASVRGLLPGSTKIIWVWDRGFDDQDNYRKVLGWRDKFVGRVYHNRKVLVNGKDCGLLDWGIDLPIMNRFNVKLSFGGRRRRVRIDLGWGKFEFEGHCLWLLRARILWVEGIDVNRLREREWWLVTNIQLSGYKIARRVWGYYRRRWEIESFFKFLKEGLGVAEFQVLTLEEIRRIVGLVVVASFFIYRLIGAITEEPIKVLLYLGGWTGRDKPGKIVLKRGLAVFLSCLFVDAFLKSHEFS